MLFTEVRNPIVDATFLINVEQITSIDSKDKIIWLADGGGKLRVDNASINKILNILRIEGAIH